MKENKFFLIVTAQVVVNKIDVTATGIAKAIMAPMCDEPTAIGP